MLKYQKKNPYKYPGENEMGAEEFLGKDFAS